MNENNILACPFCGSTKVLERQGIVYEPYPDKELLTYRCLECGKDFIEKEETTE